MRVTEGNFNNECQWYREGHIFLVILEEKLQVVLCVSLVQFNVLYSDRHALSDIFLLYQLNIKDILWCEQWWRYKWYKSMVSSWPVMASLGVKIFILPTTGICGQTQQSIFISHCRSMHGRYMSIRSDCLIQLWQMKNNTCLHQSPHQQTIKYKI